MTRVRALLKRARNQWRNRPFWLLPALCYLLSFLSTTAVGVYFYGDGQLLRGLLFSVPLMTILTCHELGHFLQVKKYRVPASLPYFLPSPLPPLGTFGAIIIMRGNTPDRRALFDVGVSGPLAGLVVTLVFLVLGMALSHVQEVGALELPNDIPGYFEFGEPLILQWVAKLILHYDPQRHEILMHPLASAAWVGLLLTTLNLFPVSQLDGGHVFYALLRKNAYIVSKLLYFTACVAVVLTNSWNWALLLLLILFAKLRHAPTQNDNVPLGVTRVILGWATLAFILVGFTPNPLAYRDNPNYSPNATQQSILSDNANQDPDVFNNNELDLSVQARSNAPLE
ncbi:MAG: site-2 protease family protein [Planctomycetia bacterium]|nr:site-2 protease family protein [Planctomycetia bacterium]